MPIVYDDSLKVTVFIMAVIFVGSSILLQVVRSPLTPVMKILIPFNLVLFGIIPLGYVVTAILWQHQVNIAQPYVQAALDEQCEVGIDASEGEISRVYNSSSWVDTFVWSPTHDEAQCEFWVRYAQEWRCKC